MEHWLQSRAISVFGVCFFFFFVASEKLPSKRSFGGNFWARFLYEEINKFFRLLDCIFRLYYKGEHLRCI